MKIWKCTLWTLLLLFLVECCQCARILGIFPFKSKSHYFIWRRITSTLASRGHAVTVLSRMEGNQVTPNYTHIYLPEGLYDAVDTLSVERNNVTDVFDLMKMVDGIEPGECSMIFEHDILKKMILSKSSIYDLIFMEIYYFPCYLVLASYINVPIIWFTTQASHYPADLVTGNPNNPAYMPSIVSGLSTDMSFTERLVNIYQTSVIHYYQANVYMPAIVDQFNKQHNARISLEQVYHQTPNLVFNYGHFTLIPRPKLPNVVEIGGIHIEEEKPLSKDINDFIEEAKHGVIFFSFGTTLRCSSIPEQKMRMLKEVFAKIPQRILWRCDIASEITDVSDNVMIRYWFSQRDVLAHKNVRAFISHCGLLGTYEAIYTATPMIGIPFLYDQFTNIRLLKSNGVAIHLNYHDLTADILLESINEIMNNSKYKENMERLSEIFRDQPLPPLDTAMYWIEYVIRHKGAPHLKSPAANMPLYQYLLLDVIGFLAICILLTLYIIYFSIRKLFVLSRYYYNLLMYSKEKSS